MQPCAPWAIGSMRAGGARVVGGGGFAAVLCLDGAAVVQVDGPLGALVGAHGSISKLAMSGTMAGTAPLSR